MDVWRKMDSISVGNRKQTLIGILPHCDLRVRVTRNKIPTTGRPSVAWEVSDTYRITPFSISELFTQNKELTYLNFDDFSGE